MNDDFIQLAAKVKEAIKRESAKALADIDAYVIMATSHPYAAHEDIQGAIEQSRAAQDAVSSAKSNAVIAIDNTVKEQETDSSPQ